MAVLLQYLLPKQAITQIAGKLANYQGGFLTTSVITWFAKRYQVNMTEAVNPDITSYKTFNDFFTRPLKSGARPIAQADFICPVDGAVSQFGEIKKDQIFQAKGHSYSTLALLGGNKSLAKKFENGYFSCLYLSPKDYHRIHMPCKGTLKSMTYIPGSLFSVNPTTAQGIPGLFAKNERVVCEFNSKQHGDFIIVLVGATIVGSMATVWHDAANGIINPPRTGKPKTWNYNQSILKFEQGEEIGRFLLGSTVVMLFEKGSLQFNPKWSPASVIKLGEVMGNKQL